MVSFFEDYKHFNDAEDAARRKLADNGLYFMEKCFASGEVRRRFIKAALGGKEILGFTPKQRVVWANTIGAYHRWNVSCGATRSGKTFLDYFKIPARITTAASGTILLLGNTNATLERNILEPMRGFWGDNLVGRVNGRNEVFLFGRKCHAFGADKITQVDRLRGAGVVYCYGDEVATWHKGVFDMLKSRLDKPTSCFDGTCNPEGPTHWFKAFLETKDIDVYRADFTIDDNPFLPPLFVENLKKEYAGTIFYDRYILGLWTQAEGAIYRVFTENERSFTINKKDLPKRFERIVIGIDWGDSGSGHSFTATGIELKHAGICVLKTEKRDAKNLTPADVERLVVNFVKSVIQEYGNVSFIFCDHINTFINGCRDALNRAGVKTPITRADKHNVNDRILTTCKMLGLGRMRITNDCETLAKALKSAIWDAKHPDRRLDDGTSDIDSLDSFEYSWSRFLGLLNAGIAKGR